MKNIKYATVALLATMLALSFTLTACNTTQQRTAYNTLFSVESSTTAAVDGYYTATIKGIAPTNGIPKVSSAYNDFQKAFLVALDAAQYNTNALASASLQQESADVISLVGQFWKGN